MIKEREANRGGGVIKHHDLVEHLTGGKVHIRPAPEGLKTFATDLETGDVYVPDKPFAESGVGLTDPEEHFCILHETVGHLKETIDMLEEEGGPAKLERHIQRLKKSKAFGLMDNCVADIRENRAVVARAGADYAQVEQALYKEKLFKDLDFTARPRHIQFCEALLREARVPDQVCQVAPEVRVKLDELNAIVSSNGVKLLDAMTRPNTPMSWRLRLQDQYIWPIVQELMEQDKKDKKDKKEDPNDMFADDYKESAKRMPHGVNVEEKEKALENWKQTHTESPLDKADQEYADKLGVGKEDLQMYRGIVSGLERTINPETGENVIEELRRLIERIIAKRIKPALAPRYPVEEGEELMEPAELYTQVKAGNLQPKVWETKEIKEVRGKKFGEVEVTLVCDRSGSMAGAKLTEQRKAAVLMMEALNQFAERSREEAVNMDKPLVISSEVYSFQATSEDAKPLLPMSDVLGEKERIEVAATLGTAPGKSTTDFVSLEAIIAGLTENQKRKVTEGELKKIVIVFTDGDSHGKDKVAEACKILREAGIVVVGVGITQDGASALTTYAPNARLAEQAEQLPGVLGDLLREHLSGL